MRDNPHKYWATPRQKSIELKKCSRMHGFKRGSCRGFIKFIKPYTLDKLSLSSKTSIRNYHF